MNLLTRRLDGAVATKPAPVAQTRPDRLATDDQSRKLRPAVGIIRALAWSVPFWIVIFLVVWLLR